MALQRYRERRPQRRVTPSVGALERCEIQMVARDSSQRARLGAHQADGARQDLLEHWPDVRLRAADDAQDVAGGRLLVERISQMLVAGFELLEQAHVLEPHDRLD